MISASNKWPCQNDDTRESRTADLEHHNKRLKSNGCDAVYTACMIGQYLSERKQIYHGNKKLFIYATKQLFTISYVYFFVDLYDLARTYYRVSRISLPLMTVRSIFKLIKEIVHEDEDFCISMLNDILSWSLKHVLINFFLNCFKAISR